jgi:hypothetical protein
MIVPPMGSLAAEGPLRMLHCVSQIAMQTSDNRSQIIAHCETPFFINSIM